MIKLLLVDDKRINRQTVKEKLQYENAIHIIGEASTGLQFVQFLNETNNEEDLPDVVLMDIDMPEMNGIEAIAIGSTRFPEMKFIVLTVFDDDDKIFDAIQAGANGYLLKEDSTIQLVEAIRQAHEGTGAPMSPAIARKTLLWVKQNLDSHKSSNNYILSEREMEILREVTAGHDYKAIAEHLFISPATVRTHITKIYEKMHVHSKAQAIQMAHKLKWV
jgi:DNA-binding NarL/FixJ family response regulator